MDTFSAEDFNQSLDSALGGDCDSLLASLTGSVGACVVLGVLVVLVILAIYLWRKQKAEELNNGGYRHDIRSFGGRNRAYSMTSDQGGLSVGEFRGDYVDTQLPWNTDPINNCGWACRPPFDATMGMSGTNPNVNAAKQVRSDGTNATPSREAFFGRSEPPVFWGADDTELETYRETERRNAQPASVKPAPGTTTAVAVASPDASVTPVTVTSNNNGKVEQLKINFRRPQRRRPQPAPSTPLKKALKKAEAFLSGGATEPPVFWGADDAELEAYKFREGSQMGRDLVEAKATAAVAATAAANAANKSGATVTAVSASTPVSAPTVVAVEATKKEHLKVLSEHYTSPMILSEHYTSPTILSEHYTSPMILSEHYKSPEILSEEFQWDTSVHEGQLASRLRRDVNEFPGVPGPFYAAIGDY